MRVLRSARPVPQGLVVMNMSSNINLAYELNGERIARERFYAIACDPRRSVVVEACAGAGKTWMLVSRILRALRGSAPWPGNGAKREQPPLARAARLTPPYIVPAHSVPLRSTQTDMTRLSDSVWRSSGWLV